MAEVRESATALKKKIKGAILANQHVTARELKKQFPDVSLITLSAIRTEFISDLKLLRDRGFLR